jgi:hypothetical protein
MNAVTKPSPQVKLEADTSGERDLMLSAIRDEGLLDHLPSFNAAEQNWSSPGWKKAAADYHAERRDEAAK